MDHTIKVRLPGGAEFEASGSQEAVSAQFEAFLKLAGAMPVQVVAPPSPPTSAPPSAVGHEEPVRNAGAELQGLVGRVFRSDGNVVSLNALPQTDNVDFDTIALLLYGYRHVRGQSSVIVGDLIEGLRKSGASVHTQTSKIVAPFRTLVTMAGVKRGSRYTLTNKGQSHAEEVMRGLDL
jgi:hypothetical protein